MTQRPQQDVDLRGAKHTDRDLANRPHPVPTDRKDTMRFIIYGAGGIGGTIGACLHQHGEKVLLIARGAHLEKIRADGLNYKTPLGSTMLPIPCAGHPSEIEFTDDDVVLLTMKSQDTRDALNALRDAAGEDIPVICCQNGVANERMALRRFSRVYGMVVILPASHMAPGIVHAEAVSTKGILDAGCYPEGTDDLIEAVTATLSASEFSSRPDKQVMRWKYSKLLMNLGNALQAVADPGGDAGDIYRTMTREALDCYEAAGVHCADREESTVRRGDTIQMGTIEGQPRGGGSSWQSIVRGAGSIEADYLNGEIVLLGKLWGIPTPVNRALQVLANRLVREKGRAGSVTLDQVREEIDRQTSLNR